MNNLIRNDKHTTCPGTGNQYKSQNVKGCASGHICDDPLKWKELGENITCCWGNLCNGVTHKKNSITGRWSFLFLSCSLLCICRSPLLLFSFFSLEDRIEKRQIMGNGNAQGSQSVLSAQQETVSKGCASSPDCKSWSVGTGCWIREYINKCCDTDHCNADPGSLSQNLNGKRCYTCDEEDCSKTVSCWGNENYCFTAYEPSSHQLVDTKGCASKSACDQEPGEILGFNGNIICCEGNLCNVAQSVTQTFMDNGVKSVTQSLTYNSVKSVNQSFMDNAIKSVTQRFLFLCYDSRESIYEPDLRNLDQFAEKLGDEVTTATGCAMPNECDLSVLCCDTDLCNEQNDSGISQYSALFYKDPSAKPLFQQSILDVDCDLPYDPYYVDCPEGKICYTCEEENCSQIQSCVRDEDYCFTAKENQYQSLTKGCASERMCEDPRNWFGPGDNITCCSGNLCNGAHNGFCLDCYDCQDQPEGPCENQITCDDEHSMCASRGISKYESSESFCKCRITGLIYWCWSSEEVTTATGCAMPNECDSFSIQCCDTDLCNQQDDSGISQYSDSTYGYDYVDYSNGKICYTCEKENCSQIQSCVRDEDYCFTAKGNHYQSHTLKGCASKRRCEDPSDSFGPGYSITCCWGDLCNSAQIGTKIEIISKKCAFPHQCIRWSVSTSSWKKKYSAQCCDTDFCNKQDAPVRRVVKPSVKRLRELELKSHSIYLSHQDADLGTTFQQLLEASPLAPEQKETISARCLAFLKEVLAQCQMGLPASMEMLRKLELPHMHLQASAVLLFILLTGGFSLVCYECSSQQEGPCEEQMTCNAVNNSCTSRRQVIYNDLYSNQNGKKCHTCHEEDCSNTVSCRGNEDYCFTGNEPSILKGCASKYFCDDPSKILPSVNITCCSGDLCNGAQSVTQSLLFLCCSLLSFMHLQVSIVLFFILLTGGFSLDCYKCQDQPEPSCEEQMTCDNEQSMCARRTTIKIERTEHAETTKKSCVMLDECESWSFTKHIWSKAVSVQCCDTDLCSEQTDREYQKQSQHQPQIVKGCASAYICYNATEMLELENHSQYQPQTVKGCASANFCYNETEGLDFVGNVTCCEGNLCNDYYSYENRRRCFTCDKEDCSYEVFCQENEDYCFTAYKNHSQYQPQTVKGCASTNFCYNKTEGLDFVGNVTCCWGNLCNDFNTYSHRSNGKRCYTCDSKDCLKIMNCWGNEDYCFSSNKTLSHQSVAKKGCASKSACERELERIAGPYGNVTCCEGNLCNGAQSVTQSFLFLCCSVLSFILLH
ncbi:Xenoxin-2 [Labeo rohita]|uniref:Xenoxin-2 n=1 Tax=Labeo rohita TaxID=84645 RepID=A0ABQ8LLU4_LABRO|nr:Xenoxin-2 [Labeo rohita]